LSRQLFVKQDVVLNQIHLDVARHPGILRTKVAQHGVDHNPCVITQMTAGFADES
jgi:hypothetical protein